MSKIRTAALGVVSALAIGTCAVVNADQAAAASCHISVSGLPTKVSIDGNTRVYSFRGSKSGCSSLDSEYSYVTASIVGPNSSTRVQDSYVMAGFDSNEKYYLFSDEWRAGSYKVVDGGSTVVNDDYDDLSYTWNVKSMAAKYDANISLSASRSGSKVKISGAVKRYSPAAWDYVNQNRYVYIQRYSGGTWKNLKVVKSPSGRYSYTYSTKSSYKYRAKLAEKSDTWASTSRTVTK
ncbi:hypothetical protein [Microlunatus soli]|uniref:Uncharacterized protein n=1 Tax=Microlunatus soli TaxID=630515 RepID=A0A1H1S983_9ACTN|nr:hypothetical protein [Microlunatus soli]SDS44443.1 hypothetical protein SAMN04489812_1924 [Microlunatus soli]